MDFNIDRLAFRYLKLAQELKTKTAEKTSTKAFGYQLLLDFYGCKASICDDLDLCYNFLDKIVADIEMEKQGPPQVIRSDNIKYPDKAGISGWVPLIESSVVIHTLSKLNFISIDIYSCRHFDPKKTEEFCKKYFHPKQAERQFLERGVSLNDRKNNRSASLGFPISSKSIKK